MTTLLDGPLGTELEARGVQPARDCWSAEAIETAPGPDHRYSPRLCPLGRHRSYCQYVSDQPSGQRFLLANTDRNGRPADQERGIPEHHRVAGSMAPVEDCYRPDLSPGIQSESEHREMAETLTGAGCDLLLCETFCHPEETLTAVRAAVACGLETWVALTAGPQANLMSPATMAQLATLSVDQGAAAVLVNCTPANDTQRFVKAVVETGINVPVGAYANAGSPGDEIGWRADSDLGFQTYANHAQKWVMAGASIIGGCCGTGPGHLAAVRDQLAINDNFRLDSGHWRNQLELWSTAVTCMKRSDQIRDATANDHFSTEFTMTTQGLRTAAQRALLPPVAHAPTHDVQPSE